MKPTSKLTRSFTAIFPGLAGYLLLLLLSGCGLAMDNEDRLDRAAKAYAEGDYRAAIIDAKNVLLDEPENVRARLLLGRVSLELGDPASAEKELRRAVELGTSIDEVSVALGRALLQLQEFESVITEITADTANTIEDRLEIYQIRGMAFIGLKQYETARDIFTKILDSDDENLDAQLGIVTSYIREGNLVQARGTLDHVLTSNSDLPQPWIVSGKLNLQLRNLDVAVTDFDRARDLAVSQSNTMVEVEALIGLGDVLFAKAEHDRAREVVDRLNAIAADSLGVKLLTARLAYIDRDWRKAQEALQHVLSRSPNNRAAQILLGATQLQSGNLAQAEMYLQAVVAATPDNADARRLLAEARLQLDRMEEAQEILRPIISGPNADIRSLSLAAIASARSGEFDEAIAYINRALGSDPDNRELQFQLASAYLSAGQTDEAQRLLESMSFDSLEKDQYRRDHLLVVTELRKGNVESARDLAKDLVSRWPKEASSHNLLGSIQLSDGDIEAARGSFNAAAMIAPENLVSARNLARVDEAEGNIQASRDRYLRILKTDPTAAWAMFALARLAARDEDLENTRIWLERAIEVDRQWIAPRILLGKAFLVGGDFDSAKNVARESLTIDDTNPELHNTLGLALLGQREYRESRRSFTNAVRLDAANPAYRLNLARALRNAGDTAGALAALEESPGQMLAHLPSAVMMASLKVESGDLEDATAIVDGLRDRYPESAVPHALEGEIYAQQGKLRKASDAYDRAMAIQMTKSYAVRAFQLRNNAGLADRELPLQNYLKMRPLDTNIRLLLAQNYHATKRIDESVNEFERLIDIDPDNAIALNNLAWIYYEKGDARALETARRAYELMPDNDSILDTLGWILVETGSAEDGAKYLEAAVARSDGRSEIRYHHAVALAKLGKVEQARDILNEILASDEQFTSRNDAEKLLAEL